MTDQHPLSLQIDYQRRMERTFGIMAEYADGTPVEEIAEKYEVAPSTVIKWAKKAGLTRNKQWRDKAPAVAIRYAEGVPLAQIEAEFGISRKGIWTIAKRAGLPMRRAPNPSAQETP